MNTFQETAVQFFISTVTKTAEPAEQNTIDKLNNFYCKSRFYNSTIDCLSLDLYSDKPNDDLEIHANTQAQLFGSIAEVFKIHFYNHSVNKKADYFCLKLCFSHKGSLKEMRGRMVFTDGNEEELAWLVPGRI